MTRGLYLLQLKESWLSVTIFLLKWIKWKVSCRWSIYYTSGSWLWWGSRTLAQQHDWCGERGGNWARLWFGFDKDITSSKERGRVQVFKVCWHYFSVAWEWSVLWKKHCILICGFMASTIEIAWSMAIDVQILLLGVVGCGSISHRVIM